MNAKVVKCHTDGYLFTVDGNNVVVQGKDIMQYARNNFHKLDIDNIEPHNITADMVTIALNIYGLTLVYLNDKQETKGPKSLSYVTDPFLIKCLVELEATDPNNTSDLGVPQIKRTLQTVIDKYSELDIHENEKVVETVVLDKAYWERTLDMLNKMSDLNASQVEFIKLQDQQIKYLQELVELLEKQHGSEGQ